MARSTPTAYGPSLTGTVVAAGAPSADGDVIPAGAVVLVMATTDPVTVTADATLTDGGLELEDAEGTVAAGTWRLFGPYDKRRFAQAADAEVGAGRVLVNYSAVTGVTRLVLA